MENATKSTLTLFIIVEKSDIFPLMKKTNSTTSLQKETWSQTTLTPRGGYKQNGI